MRALAPLPVIVTLLLCAASALAQDSTASVTEGATAASTDASSDPLMEGIDPTRLDVERLPPEAIEITRDLYSHGFFFEGWIGGRGFIGGIGTLSNAGLFSSLGMGVEIFQWLWVKLAFEGSLHTTSAPPPPSATVFELVGAVAELKLQVDFTERVAVWVQGEFGALLSTGDVLPTYGVTQAADVGLMYGGSLGFDWHLYNRHYSIGLLGGARLYPSLETIDGQMSIGVHGAIYLRYVI